MGFFKVNNDEYIELELWGGHQIYYKKSKKYVIVRDCGIFSNFTVVLFGVFILTTEGYIIDDIEITMLDYYRDTNVYPILFKKKEGEFNLNEFTNEEISFFRENCYPSICGLGLKNWSTVQSTKENFNLKITNKIIERFFTPNDNVIKSLENKLSNKGLTKNDYVFIWARRTDKIEETKVPDAKAYYSVLESNGLLGEKIFVQTDDSTMFDEFKNLDLNFDYFEEIPFAKQYSFHRKISNMTDPEFLETYNVTKEQYIIDMMCVVLLSANAKKAIIYPGNPTTVVPMYKNSFEDCILFKDDKEIF